MLNLSPSLMCADQGYFAEEVKQLEAAGATTFHMDIMDGEFVPNFALSWAQVGYCRKISKLNLEAHLMVKTSRLIFHLFILAELARYFSISDILSSKRLWSMQALMV